MNTLFADAANPLIIPAGGSVLVAGIFLSLACISGGFWLIRRYQGLPAGRPRKVFLIGVGGFALFGSVAPCFLGVFAEPAWIALAALMLVLGVGSTMLAFRAQPEHK